MIRRIWSITLAGILAFASWTASAAPKNNRLPDIDRREADRGIGPNPSSTQATAAEHLKARLPDARVDFDKLTGAPRIVSSWRGFLSAPDGGNALPSAPSAASSAAVDADLPAKTFLNEHRDLFGHGAEVLAAARVARAYTTPHNGLRTMVWQQQVDGIPVFEAVLLAHTTKRGELVNIASHFLPNLSAAQGKSQKSPKASAATISAERAIQSAATNVGDEIFVQNVSPVGLAAAGNERKRTFITSGLSGDIAASLVWLPMSRKDLRLCWDVLFTSRSRGQMFRSLVDAQTGEVLVRRCLTRSISDASYRVYTSDSPSPFSPGHSTPQTNQPPFTARTLVTLPALITNASPAGWINDGDNETLGNNVDAHTDRNNDDYPDLPRPTGSPFRVFDFPMDLAVQDPTNYSAAAVAQLFYTCNWMHDRLYELGFTEAAGNFQTDNFGRGGQGGDALSADAQDGGDTDNADMSTPPDGFAPRMQMYIFGRPLPRRDGDFDTEVVLHEYTHGLSARLVGGGVGIQLLQTDGMGEGWSDFYALAMLSEPADNVDGVYAVGAYVTYQLGSPNDLRNYYFGIRRYPYSTDISKNPLTFNDIDPSQADHCVSGAPFHNALLGNCSPSDSEEVHNQGEVWCVALWEARANLIAKYGWAVGNELILQLVTDGMRLSPANPNFLEARNAILQADLVNNSGANQTELWLAFAKRGMGFSATSPGSSTTVGVVESFVIPDDLAILPFRGFVSSGPFGGPFNISSNVYSLTNLGSAALNWSAINTSAWLSVSPSSGVLSTGMASQITVALTGAASSQTQGVYRASVVFSNQTSGIAQPLGYVLRVGQPDYLMEQFGTLDPALDYQSWTFTPDGSTNFYSVCRQAVAEFPTDPSGGNELTLTDDSYARISLAGLNTVAIYNHRTNVFFIGSNGYLTMGSGDTEWQNSVTAHFNRPRVSALFTDLNPASDGTVTWKQLNNRVAITYSAVPEYDTANANSFQMELFFDGRIRITLLGNDANTGIIGLSEGNGVPDDFFESAFTTYPSCEPWLTLQMPASVLEGQGKLVAAGQVGLPQTIPGNVSVQLTTMPAGQLVIPASVNIHPGQTSAVFDVTVPENALLDGTRQITIKATAAGFGGETAYTLIDDNESAVLGVQFASSVGEWAGVVTGSVTVSAAPGADVHVQLFSSDTTELKVPDYLHIPAGQTSSIFNATLVDDSLSDGPQPVTITAHIANWTDGIANVTVLDNDTNSVAVFDDPAFVDTTSGSYFAESDNVQASLTNMGVIVSTFTNILSATNNPCLLFPSMENGDLGKALTAPQRAALSNFVMNGGKVILHGTYSSDSSSASLFNAVFGWSVQEASSEAFSFAQTPAATGTEFADDPPTIYNNDYTSTLLVKSLPPGTHNIYSEGDECAVALIPRGLGSVIYLGWDWYDAKPLGEQDYGWLDVLQSAVLQKSLPLNPILRAAGSTIQTEDCSENGAIDPEERVLVDFGLRNIGNRSTTSLVATLLVTNGVTAPGPAQSQYYGALPAAGTTVFKPFSFTAVGSCGGLLSPTLQLQDGTNDLGTVTYHFTLGSPSASVLAQNFDGVAVPALPEGWTTSVSGSGIGWNTTGAFSDSAPNSVFAPNLDGTGSEYLLSPTFFMPTNAGPLTFRHAYNTETCCDSAALQISINGGAFADIVTAGGQFLENGYNSVVGWRGISEGFPAFINTEVLLPAAALGQNVRLRWSMVNDPYVHAQGWYVDSISLDSYACCDAGFPHLLQPGLTNGLCKLRFKTILGQSYTVLYKNSLSDTNWLPLESFPGDGSVMTVGYPTTTNATRYYRLRVP